MTYLKYTYALYISNISFKSNYRNCIKSPVITLYERVVKDNTGNQSYPECFQN